MIGRIRRPVDYERALSAPRRADSAHFAFHHLPEAPAKVLPRRLSAKLSTDSAQDRPQLVDDSLGRWLGTVVPKRHAKRSVTRNLMRRQIRTIADAQGDALPAGLCVIRLKRPFDLRQYPSAASDALRQAVRDELMLLFRRATRPRAAPEATP
jgi:ribonuclease P protein component